jgi:hypothetical protein
MKNSLNELTTADKVLYAALLGSMKSAGTAISSFSLQGSEYSSCPYNQAVYINHLMHSGLIDMRCENSSYEDVEEYIDISENYNVTLKFNNTNETIKAFISEARSLIEQDKIPLDLKEILKMELIGECHSFLTICVNDFGLTISPDDDPPEIISKMLQETSINEACSIMEQAIYNFGKNKLRIKLSMDDENDSLNALYEEIEFEFNKAKTSRYACLYSHHSKKTGTSAILFVLSEYCSIIDSDYWNERTLWKQLKLSEAKGKIKELLS